MVVSKGSLWFKEIAGKPTNYSLSCTLVLHVWVINHVTKVGLWLQPLLFSQMSRIAPMATAEVNHRPSDLSCAVITLFIA